MLFALIRGQTLIPDQTLIPMGAAPLPHGRGWAVGRGVHP